MKVKDRIKNYICKYCKRKYPFSTEEYRKMHSNHPNKGCCGDEECKDKAVAKILEKVKQQRQKAWNKRKEKLKEEVGINKPPEQEPLQMAVNQIARLLDKGKPCIVKPWWDDKGVPRDGGHTYCIGANESLRYCLLNIHGESKASNRNQHITDKERAEGFIDRYGEIQHEALLWIRRENDYIGLSKKDKVEKARIARQIIKELKDGKKMTRRSVDERLGIYKLPKEYNV